MTTFVVLSDLTAGEHETLYEAAVSLVRARLEKALSV
jgi:hypothetical protein